MGGDVDGTRWVALGMVVDLAWLGLVVDLAAVAWLPRGVAVDVGVSLLDTGADAEAHAPPGTQLGVASAWAVAAFGGEGFNTRTTAAISNSPA